MCAKIYRKLDITKFESSGKEIVSKSSAPTGRDLILNEMKLVSELDHPNIYKIHESFEDKYKIYFIIDEFRGRTLFDRIIQKG